MELRPTPDVRRETLLIGSAIRKTPDIVAAYLKGLASQRPIEGVDYAYHFILDTDDDEVIQMVGHFLEERDGMAEFADSPTVPYDDNHPVTHQWSAEAMGRVGQLKNKIITRARDINAVALWFCDADLVCDPGTLRSLWYADKPVTCAVYWTKWNSDPKIMSAPQVWLRHPYDLTGRGYPDDAAFRRQLLTKELTQVWGQGACTLIRRDVLALGINFSYLPGVPLDGMMAGEDRHFCIACEQRHIPMYADPWPHIFHVYHVQDRERIPEMTAALCGQSLADCTDTAANSPLNRENNFTKTPRWLNLRMSMLEPVPTGPQSWGHMQPVNVRVRVGAREILPDLEYQCLEHLDGQPFMATVNYPYSFPIPWLRNTKRLMEVIVVDYRDADFPPVIEEEMYCGMDLSQYSAQQQEVLGAR